MKTFAVFYVLDNVKSQPNQMTFITSDPYYRELSGDRSIYVLDGRNNINTMVQDCEERILKLKNIVKIDGFKICRGVTINRDVTEIYSSF